MLCFVESEIGPLLTFLCKMAQVCVCVRARMKGDLIYSEVRLRPVLSDTWTSEQVGAESNECLNGTVAGPVD